MDNDLSGYGSDNTAEFLEYDTRLGPGGRWNMDPVWDVSQSPYTVFDNDPINMADINGDEATDGDTKSNDTKSITTPKKGVHIVPAAPF